MLNLSCCQIFTGRSGIGYIGRHSKSTSGCWLSVGWHCYSMYPATSGQLFPKRVIHFFFFVSLKYYFYLVPQFDQPIRHFLITLFCELLLAAVHVSNSITICCVGFWKKERKLRIDFFIVMHWTSWHVWLAVDSPITDRTLVSAGPVTSVHTGQYQHWQGEFM